MCQTDIVTTPIVDENCSDEEQTNYKSTEPILKYNVNIFMWEKSKNVKLTGKSFSFLFLGTQTFIKKETNYIEGKLSF